MVNYDLHVHTRLSACADKQAIIADYAECAARLGLTLVGFSDHSWDSSVAGAPPWYVTQGYERLASRRDESAGHKGLPQLFFGAEGEYQNGILGLSEKGAGFVDYVIIPHSHTHMMPAICNDLPENHAEYLVKSFLAVCRHEKRSLFFGIAHPFFPVGKSHDEVEEILAFISDSQLFDCMCVAKNEGLFIELNLSCFKTVSDGNYSAYAYSRVIKAAKDAGCGLFIGSDAHSVKSFEARHMIREDVITSLSLCDDDFKAAQLRILNG